MDVALEDVNGLLSQLNLGVSGFQQEDGAKFEKSSSLVVEQVLTLERALTRQHDGGDDQPGRQPEDKSEARGLVDVAIARGMPRPVGGTDDSTARCSGMQRLWLVVRMETRSPFVQQHVLKSKPDTLPHASPATRQFNNFVRSCEPHICSLEGSPTSCDVPRSQRERSADMYIIFRAKCRVYLGMQTDLSNS